MSSTRHGRQRERNRRHARCIETRSGEPDVSCTPPAAAALGRVPVSLSSLRVAVVAADAATLELLREWLTEAGCTVADAAARDAPPGSPCDLVIVDVPYARAWRDGPQAPSLAGA